MRINSGGQQEVCLQDFCFLSSYAQSGSLDNSPVFFHLSVDGCHPPLLCELFSFWVRPYCGFDGGLCTDTRHPIRGDVYTCACEISTCACQKRVQGVTLNEVKKSTNSKSDAFGLDPFKWDPLCLQLSLGLASFQTHVVTKPFRMCEGSMRTRTTFWCTKTM